MGCYNKCSNFEGKPLEDQSQYRMLIRILLYLTINWPNISYVVRCLSQYHNQPQCHHMHATTHLLCYLKSNMGDGLFFQQCIHYKLEPSVMLIGQDAKQH